MFGRLLHLLDRRPVPKDNTRGPADSLIMSPRPCISPVPIVGTRLSWLVSRPNISCARRAVRAFNWNWRRRLLGIQRKKLALSGDPGRLTYCLLRNPFECRRCIWLKEKFPERFFNVGI